MGQRDEDFRAWDSLWERIDAFAAVLSRHKAQHVNAVGLRHKARDIVKDYFREVKPAIHRLGVADTSLAELDSQMQRLIGLATGRNSKSSYKAVVQLARAERKKVETGLEFLIGAESPTPTNRPHPAGIEAAILRTLRTLLPTAADSYEQVLRDVHDTGRASYRGVAADLREVVREVLDHLAPDADVTGSLGFKLEVGQKGPTMRQKVNFILRARKVGDSARQTALESIEHIKENAGLVGRAVYSRGAADVHSAKPREEVLNFKGYADALLAELLEIHKSSETAVTLEERNEYLKFIADSRAEQLRKAGLAVRFPRLAKKVASRAEAVWLRRFSPGRISAEANHVDELFLAELTRKREAVARRLAKLDPNSKEYKWEKEELDDLDAAIKKESAKGGGTPGVY